MNNTDRKILTDIYNNQLDKVSEMEAIFHERMVKELMEKVKNLEFHFKELTSKYSDISRILATQF